jgi:GTPase SAR1 family protein
VLQQVKELIKDLPFENAKSSLDKLEEKLESKNLNVVLVGEFNAGKSSLINRYYGITLPVDSKPETATIWKIIVGDENKIVVHFKNGDVVEVATEEEVKKFDQKEIAYIDYFIKSDKNKGLVLVDTPGLSSLDEFHKEALTNYIKEADVVLIVTDISQGITGTTNVFLSNNVENSQKLYAVLTHSDTKSPAEREEQLNYTKDTFPCLQKVVLTSKDDVSSLDTILLDIAKQKEEIIKERVKEKLSLICQDLEFMIDDSIKLQQNATLEELKEERKKVKENIEQIELAIRKKELEFNEQLQEYIKEMQKEFQESLFAKVDWIVEALYDDNLKESIDDRFKIAIQDSLADAMKILEKNINKSLSTKGVPTNTNLSDEWYINLTDKLVYIREGIIILIEKLLTKIPNLGPIIAILQEQLRNVVDLVLKNVSKSFVKKKVSETIEAVAQKMNRAIYKEVKNLSDTLFSEVAKDLQDRKEDYLKMLDEIESKIDNSFKEKEEEINRLNNIKKELQKLCKGEQNG